MLCVQAVGHHEPGQTRDMRSMALGAGELMFGSCIPGAGPPSNRLMNPVDTFPWLVIVYVVLQARLLVAVQAKARKKFFVQNRTGGNLDIQPCVGRNSSWNCNSSIKISIGCYRFGRICCTGRCCFYFAVLSSYSLTPIHGHIHTRTLRIVTEC